MTDTKVSALTAATTLNGADYLLLVQGSNSLKIDINTLAAKFPTRISLQETPEAKTTAGALSTALQTTKVKLLHPSAAYTLGAGTHGMEKAIVCDSIETSSPKTITTATWSGGTATITVTSHGYSNGDSITIAGVTPSGYNGTYTISNVSTHTFDYTVADPGGPGTVFGTAQKVLTPTAVVTVTNGKGFTTLTLNTVGESALLRYITDGWYVIGNNGVVLA